MTRNRPMAQQHQIARARDASFFENWSAWTNLDAMPERPRDDRGAAIIYGSEGLRPWSRYYCLLRPNVRWMGGPCFEIGVPPDIHIHRMMLALPGCKRHYRVTYHSFRPGPGVENTFFVPAEHWQPVRAALPAIKAATMQWVRSRLAPMDRHWLAEIEASRA